MKESYASIDEFLADYWESKRGLQESEIALKVNYKS